MAENRLYFDPQRNTVTALYSSTAHEITKAEVPALVAKGAEVDQSARDLNQALKDAERSK